MYYSDLGYAVLNESTATEITYEAFSGYFNSIGRSDVPAEEGADAFPYTIEAEFGDNVLVKTYRGPGSITRLVTFGSFNYDDSGKLLSGSYSREYSMTYRTTGGLEVFSGDVLDLGSPYAINDFSNIDVERQYFAFLRSAVDAGQQIYIHEFDSNFPLDDVGLGRAAFSSGEASLYFQDGWQATPFGNDFLKQVESSEPTTEVVEDTGVDADAEVDASTDVVTGVQYKNKIKGTNDDDKLIGSKQNEKFFGYKGNDKIIGTAGSDYMDGGEGNDKLKGGLGSDRYVLSGGKDKFLGFSTLDGDLVEIAVPAEYELISSGTHTKIDHRDGVTLVKNIGITELEAAIQIVE